MKTPSFISALAPRDAKITGGFAGGPGIDPVALADSVFKGAISGPWLTCYMLRRFGAPNSGSDDHKHLCSWTLTTPAPGLFVNVTPHLGRPTAKGNLHFAVRYDDAVGKTLHAVPDRDAFLERKGRAILRWWNKVGAELYNLGEGQIQNDPDELVFKYAENTAKGTVSGLWRRSSTNTRVSNLSEHGTHVVHWIGRFIQERHPEVKLPRWNPRKARACHTREQIRLHAAFRATLRDLCRPVNVRDIPFTPLGSLIESKTAATRAKGLAPADRFEGAGYSAEAWLDRSRSAPKP